MSLRERIKGIGRKLADHALGAVVSVIVVALIGLLGYWLRAYFSRDCEKQLHEMQSQLQAAQAKLHSSEADLEKANKKIADLRIKQLPPDWKRLNNSAGTYIWQVVDDKKDWKGDIEVDNKGLVKDLQMTQFLNCEGERRNFRLLNLLPNASLRPDDKSANLHVEIPVQFFTYKPGSCDNPNVEEKTLDGYLTPTTAYIGSVRYKTAAGGSSGGMIIVRQLPGGYP